MRRIRKFFGLAPARRRLFFRAWGTLAKWRVTLWCVPFLRWRDRLQPVCGVDEKEAASSGVLHDTVWAVERASRYLPGATCLVRALAARELLARSGLCAELRIGVAHDERGRFEAHAWLEYEGGVVLGSPDDATRFAPLPLLMQRRQ